ncbi:MAG: cysteine--tRNA ligase [Endomicrobiia bacterium]|nr:cysteine--tRNA ligase [Endomicrobiia bacterium]
MKIKIYNTLSQKKEDFAPLDGKTARLYVCGITPYDSAHLGHARCYVAFDVIKRFLERAGYGVKHIQNFTDVDDKIINRANETKELESDRETTDGKDSSAAKERCRRLSQKYIDDYFEHIRKLGVRDADDYPKVTVTMPEIIALVGRLIERGYAYESGGDVYFSVRKFPDYGKLSKRSLDDMISGARVAPDEKKNDPLDFALWKKSKPLEPAWESPWGCGRPGWHIECSAMAQKYLGETIDIHGGGQDLIFPHHENEIAQSEAATGKTFARYFVHNGFVTINSEKMSKSLGNFFTLSDIFKKYEPHVVRYFLISQHYRSPLDFSDEGLQQSKNAVERIQNALFDAHILTQALPPKIAIKGDVVGGIVGGADETIGGIERAFDAAMSDDFNTAEALAQVHAAVSYIFILNRDKPTGLNKKTVLAAIESVNKMLDALGINLSISQAIPPDVVKLAEEREDARKSKNYKLADELRDRIKSLGYSVEDTKGGAHVKKL